MYINRIKVNPERVYKSISVRQWDRMPASCELQSTVITTETEITKEPTISNTLSSC